MKPHNKYPETSYILSAISLLILSGCCIGSSMIMYFIFWMMIRVIEISETSFRIF